MTNKVIHVTCAAAVAAALSACAATPTSITPSHVSETRYTHTHCRAIEDEQRRVEATLNQLDTKQEQNHTADAFLLTTGMILFWPALLGMAFTKDREVEIAQLMGERNALARRPEQGLRRRRALLLGPCSRPCYSGGSPQGSASGARARKRHVVIR